MARPVNFNPEKTVRLPIYGAYNSRMTDINNWNKDQRFINCYLETVTDKDGGETRYYCVKRPGGARTVFQPTGGASSSPRGVYEWNNNFYTVYGSSIYSNNTLLTNSMTTSLGICGFQPTRPGAATQYLAINDGVKLYLISSTNVVTVITSNFPTPNTRDLVFHDGYLFVLKTDGSLWNCSFDDPTTWVPSSFIYAQMLNQSAVGLAHQSNYVLVFSSSCIQYFYDNANATGSPMNNADTAMVQVGCISQQSIKYTETDAFFVGNNLAGEVVVYSVNTTSGLTQISTSAINRFLALEGIFIATCNGLLFRVGGNYFYALTLSSANRTFVYNITGQTWTEWTDTTTTPGTGITNPWQYVVVANQQGGGIIAQHLTDGFLYAIGAYTYQDNGVNFTMYAQLNKRDFDSMKRKWFNRVELVYDIQTSTAPVSIYYTDDDYNTFATARTFDMSAPRIFFRAGGTARRRAWVLSSATNTPIRWECLEVDIILGDY